jgi:hypothetical protein
MVSLPERELSISTWLTGYQRAADGVKLKGTGAYLGKDQRPANI